MKNKGMLIFITFLLIICTAAAALGFIESKKVKEPIKVPEEKAEITYVYYLEDVEVEQMPTNIKETDDEGNEIENILYEYSSHTCTNKIEGTFNTETWTFEPNKVLDGTCKIYFVKSKYEVSFVATNAAISEDNEKYIDRGESGSFIVTPTEGYEFESISCTDEKEATFDPETNKVTISNIMKDVACKIDFKIKKLEMKVTVKNGTGNTTETAEYGQSISAIIKADTGFENPKIECTNNQTATFEDNELKIYKLTDNTSCKVTFEKVPVEQFTLTIDESIPYTIKVVQGSMIQAINKNETGSFTLKADEGYEIDNVSCGDTIPTITEESNGTKYTFNEVSKNITCEVSAKIVSE